jgi:hypothetical protein
MTRIPDEALVVRGGRNYPDDIRRRIGTHPSGITGISTEWDSITVEYGLLTSVGWAMPTTSGL